MAARGWSRAWPAVADLHQHPERLVPDGLHVLRHGRDREPQRVGEHDVVEADDLEVARYRELVLTVEIPGNMTEEVHVPAAAGDEVTAESDRPAHPVRRDERYAVFATGSGAHVFEVRR